MTRAPLLLTVLALALALMTLAPGPRAWERGGPEVTAVQQDHRPGPAERCPRAALASLCGTVLAAAPAVAVPPKFLVPAGLLPARQKLPSGWQPPVPIGPPRPV
ncbi:hypothetical protein [Histidinibacterium aquaticum]|uniref:DUF2946 domain-containing protein n=1 Tax=Histidinibacterium aquaticum TaxID=2613962 RepID=A0A5J5GLP3_9RHOB|nr:hypothetical protein [Histidinibacterium aquaticum]KAA9009201.1 hypothetical protein F3S47_08075 [Histidinibacterium aquaticum]